MRRWEGRHEAHAALRKGIANPDTGKWFVIRGHGVFHEIKAKHVSGTIYEFVAIEAGQFDTLGDGTPGAEFIEETSTIVHGPHPGFADDFPFCEIAAELTGA
jgi:hypothetical protein